MSDEPKVLKFYEVTWVTASGRTLVRAEDEGEARMIASQNAEEAVKAGPGGVALPEGKHILHEWLDTKAEDNEPLIFDVEELATDTAAELRKDMEAG